MLYYSVMLCCISSYIYSRPHILCVDKLHVNYALNVSVVPPSSGMHIHCCLHVSPLLFCNVYSGYMLCKHWPIQLVSSAASIECYLMMAKGPKHIVDN
jgi:hypothetical protein